MKKIAGILLIVAVLTAGINLATAEVVDFTGTP